MKKLSYHYTNLPKQMFIIALMIHFLLKFLIMAEIVIFRIKGYYDKVNVPLTILFYAVIFAVLLAFFRGSKFCYGLYDEDTLIYRNALLRKEKKLSLAEAGLAALGTFGIKFYSSEEAEQKNDKPIFFFPFFRGGVIEAIPLNEFYLMLRSKPEIKVVKKFKILPGYSKKWRIVSILYIILALLTLSVSETPLAVMLALMQNH